MGVSWFSRKEKAEGVKRSKEQNRYDAVSNEIKSRKEYEYSLQLFRLWYSFVQNCLSEFKAQLNLDFDDNMIISLHALALYNSIHGGFPRQNDKINDTALDVLRCYTWKQLIEIHGYNDVHEMLSQLFLTKVCKRYLELDEYVTDLLNKGIDEKELGVKIVFHIVNQFEQYEVEMPIIILLIETTFLQKYGDFLSTLPGQWKDQSQRINNEMEIKTTQKDSVQNDQYTNGQINYDLTLPPEYNEEIRRIKLRPNYHKMQHVFQILCKAVDMVRQECLVSNDITTYNKIDLDALWGVVLCFFTMYYRPENLKNFELDHKTLMEILMLWHWRNDGNKAYAIKRSERIIDKAEEIHYEILKNDTPNDSKHSIRLIMIVVSRSVFKDKNDMENISKHFDYCRSAIKLILEMIKKANHDDNWEQDKNEKSQYSGYSTKRYDYRKEDTDSPAASKAETNINNKGNNACNFTIINDKKIKCQRCGELQTIRRIGGVCLNCGIRFADQSSMHN